MTYAIGDIHGCRVALETLLGQLNLSAGDTIVCLGDYIDRGPDSRGVVTCLIELRKSYDLIHLRGNHEVFLRLAMESPSSREFFLGDLVGGTPTMKSYGESLNDIPEEHLRFLLEESQLYYETDTHLFAHGGVMPNQLIAEQSEEALTSTRFSMDTTAHCSGKTVICGHTVQGDLPQKAGDHTICIDTGAFAGGWLTALEVETDTYYQANELGEFRVLVSNI